MPSSNKILITVDLADFPKFAMPVPLEQEGMTRENTIFHVIAEDQSLSFIGTYDQICDFGARLATLMMSWPIVSGHMEWIDRPADLDQEKVAVNADGN